MNIDTYRILVHSGDQIDRDPSARWRDLREGPFDTQYDAVQYASNEVGVPWIVVDGAGHPVAYGDSFGLQGDNT